METFSCLSKKVATMRISPIVLLLVAVLGCGSGKPSIDAAIRKAAGKPTGELTKADLEKVTRFNLAFNQITDLKPLAGLAELDQVYLQDNQITDLKPLSGLTRLTTVWLVDNPNLTKAEIDKLQKALPKCEINHNATK